MTPSPSGRGLGRGRLAAGRDQPRQPRDGRNQLLRRIGAHHPTAAVEVERLDDTRVEHLRGDGRRVIGGGEAAEPGHRRATVAQQAAHPVLVAGRGGSNGVVVRQAQRVAGRGGDQTAAVIHGQNGRQRLRNGIIGNARRGHRRRGKGQRQRPRPTIGQLRRQVEAGDDDHTQPLGRGAERLQPVGAHRRQQHHPLRVVHSADCNAGWQPAPTTADSQALRPTIHQIFTSAASNRAARSSIVKIQLRDTGKEKDR